MGGLGDVVGFWEAEGDGLGDAFSVCVGVDVVVGDGLGDCVEGVGVGFSSLELGASGFGSVKKGTKLTVPKVKSFLKS